MHYFKPLLAILIVAFATGSGTAGPIPSDFTTQWGAYAIYTYTSPYYGPITFQPPSAPDGGYILNVTFTPNPSGPLSYNDPAWRPGSTDEVYMGQQFQVNVGITDNASGMYDVVPVKGSVFMDWLHLGNGSWVESNEWISQVGVPGETTLGSNIYTVSIYSNGTAYNGGAPTAAVLVAVATPEPGTLGLLCCGLAPWTVTLARSLRRQQASHIDPG